MNFNPEGETKMDGSSMAMVGGLRGVSGAAHTTQESVSSKMESAARRLQSATSQLGLGVDRFCGSGPEAAPIAMGAPGDGFIAEVHMLLEIVNLCCDGLEGDFNRMARAI
jgi:hypothetical protein